MIRRIPESKEMPQDIRRMAKDGEVKHTHYAKIVTLKQRVRVSSLKQRHFRAAPFPRFASCARSSASG